MPDIERIVADNNFLYGQNGDWRSYWEDLADFTLPRKAFINTIRTKGERLKFNFLYNSEAIRDAQICASGFHTHLNNPATRWFMMQSRDIDLMDYTPVRKWFADTEKKIYATLAGTNFYEVMSEFRIDNVVFGTADMLIQKDFKSKVHFLNIPIEQINLTEDTNGRILQHNRNFRYTAIQAATLWGKTCCKAVADALRDNKPYQEIEFLHYVGPRKLRDYNKLDAKNMEYESVWICKKENELVKESGYKKMPFVVGRFWKDPNDVMGFSPAMNVFADVKTINYMTKIMMRRASKEADPPLDVPHKGYIMPLDFNASSINYRKPGADERGILPVGVGAGQFTITTEVMQQTIQAIRDGFFVDLFQSLGNVTKQMTVPEVQKRISESMSLLGPVVGRDTAEVLDPILTRVFDILWEDGDIEPPPHELDAFDFTFLGDLVKAQKMSEIQPTTTFLQIVGEMSQMKPETLDKVDSDKAVDIVAKILMVDPQLIRDGKEVEKIREIRAKAQAEDRALAQAHVGGQAAKSFADTHKTVQEAANVQ